MKGGKPNMKGYTIKESIDLLEKRVDNAGGGGTTAANVSYDNTTSSLTATNVQAAIDEVAAGITEALTGAS